MKKYLVFRNVLVESLTRDFNISSEEYDRTNISLTAGVGTRADILTLLISYEGIGDYQVINELIKNRINAISSLSLPNTYYKMKLLNAKILGLKVTQSPFSTECGGNILNHLIAAGSDIPELNIEFRYDNGMDGYMHFIGDEDEPNEDNLKLLLEIGELY